VVIFSHNNGLVLSDKLSTTHASSVANWEQQILDLVNGSRAYEYDLELEKIGQSHFEFRSAGSPGAHESAHWIREQLESSGLETLLEPFEFTTWNITSKPTLLIDEDGNVNSTNDQSSMETLLPTHLSWSTPPGDVFADLVVLPLPPAANRGEVGLNPLNETEWAVNTTGKVVLIGKEVGWNGVWLDTLNHKLRMQTPAAVIYTWWYDWMNFTPPLMSSSGGRWHWYLSLPSGSVDYEEGLWIRNREKAVNVSALVSIRSVIGEGTNYNVVGKIEGYKNPEKYVIISGHYDTVVTSGFCDNGAGTAGVVELARVFADAVRMGIYRPRYTLVFVAFTSEELALVGSINYIARHKNDMPNIIAVINLDCIGSDNFAYSETEPVNGFDLDQIVNQAAQDVGISSLVEEPGGSDHESFRNPIWADDLYQYYWQLDANISDAQPVPSSILLISQPLFYSDKWSEGIAGYIHTSYDNSTSTQTHSWVEANDLENHIEVAALTIARVSPTPALLGDVNYDGIVDVYDGILLANAFQSRQGQQDWDANADINDDKVVDIYDAIVLASHFGSRIS